MDKDTTTVNLNGVEVTEDDLRKSLAEIEGKKIPAEPAKDPVVATAVLEKNTRQSIEQHASTELKKALEVSPVLKEIVGSIALHNDAALEVLQKSIHEAAQRDLSVVRGLVELKKSIDANTEAIKLFGTAPAAAPKTTPTAVATEVLEKNAAGATPAGTADPKKLDSKVVIQVLAKSAMDATKAGETDEANKFTRIVTKIEAAGAGSLNDQEMFVVQSELKKRAA